MDGEGNPIDYKKAGKFKPVVVEDDDGYMDELPEELRPKPPPEPIVLPSGLGMGPYNG